MRKGLKQADALILVSENRLDRDFGLALARELGVALIQPRGIEDQIGALRADSSAEALFDADSPDLYSKVEPALLVSPEMIIPRFHFVSSHGLDRCHSVLRSPFFLSHIRRNGPLSDRARFFRPLCRSRIDGVLGMDQCLSEREDRSFPIESNLEKIAVLETLRSFLKGAELGERNLGIVVTAADELLMNGIFDAPVDEMGTRINIGSTRTSPIRLQGRRRIELRAGYDSTHVAVEVRDFFGSLEKNRLFDKLAEIYGPNEYRIDSRSAGAGLGLASVHRSGGSLLFDCRAGELTSVTALFARLETAQGLRDAFRFIRSQFH